MKNCVWLKPELVAQIEFAEWRWRTNYGILGLLGCGEGKAVISCNNPLKPDMSGLVIQNESRQFTGKIPAARTMVETIRGNIDGVAYRPEVAPWGSRHKSGIESKDAIQGETNTLLPL